MTYAFDGTRELGNDLHPTLREWLQLPDEILPSDRNQTQVASAIVSIQLPIWG